MDEADGVGGRAGPVDEVRRVEAAVEIRHRAVGREALGHAILRAETPSGAGILVIGFS